MCKPSHILLLMSFLYFWTCVIMSPVVSVSLVMNMNLVYSMCTKKIKTSSFPSFCLFVRTCNNLSIQWREQNQWGVQMIYTFEKLLDTSQISTSCVPSQANSSLLFLLVTSSFLLAVVDGSRFET